MINLKDNCEVSVDKLKHENVLGKLFVVFFFVFNVLIFNNRNDANTIKLVGCCNYYRVYNSRCLFHDRTLEDW